MITFKFNKKETFKPVQIKEPPKEAKKSSVSAILKKHDIKLSEATTLQYHQSINPKIWMPDDNIRPDVKDHLIQIAKMWVDFCKIDFSKVKDIVLTGGNANFNYTEQSDLDVHIIVDLADLGKDTEFMREYLTDKKQMWATKHKNIRVNGYPVELYAQDVSEESHFGQGVYSLLTGKWLNKSSHLGIDLTNDKDVESDSKELENKINEVTSKDLGLAEAKSLWDEIAGLRGKAISEGGEFAEKNLVFKDLRNLGLLEKLSNYISFKEDTNLSLLEQND